MKIYEDHSERIKQRIQKDPSALELSNGSKETLLHGVVLDPSELESTFSPPS